MTSLLNYLRRLLDTSALAPHGFCFLWRPELLWTHVIADAVVAVAYAAISIALVIVVRRRKDIPFGAVVWCFAIFILACGTTHFMMIWTLWRPDYGVEALVKLAAAIASVITAGLLWRMIPLAIALPSPTYLREVNERLERGIAERDQAILEMEHERTERFEAEARLSDIHDLYRHIVELGTQIPWTADADGNVLSIGQSWLDRTGASLEQVLGWAWVDAVHPDDRAVVSAAWSRALRNISAFYCDYRLSKTDGSYGWCRARAAPRLTENGSVRRWYGTIEDIDERKESLLQMQQLQSELIRVSRVNGMGAMASTIAHELNQPLTAIANYVRGSRRLLPPDQDFDAIREALNAADANAVRAGEIVRRIRGLAAEGSVDRKPEDLSEIIKDACGLAMIDAHTSGINYRVEAEPSIPEVLADRIQIQQVLFNLLRNAAEALSGQPIREIVVAAASRSDGVCEVTVRDSGPGILLENQSRLFLPFNTTKNDGMGIGLSISRTIIEAHGGQIWHDSPPEGGTLFGFTLAAAVARATP